MALIAFYGGIIAGIGDKSINANVIPPEFDARYRNFVVRKNCILEGFAYNTNTKQLSAGACLVSGYVGNIDRAISIETSNYVYGVFTVNHDSEILDSFKVEIYNSELFDPQQDDILNVAGKYYFQIYPRTDEKEYPLKAEYSDYTTVVLADGRLENGVTCPTQLVNDNSQRVANTEYVHNQIVEEINADNYENSFKLGSYDLYVKILIKRKAKLCGLQLSLSGNDIITASGAAKGFIGTIPKDFAPKTEVNFPYIATFEISDGNGNRRGAINIKLLSDGTLSFAEQTTGNTFYVLPSRINDYNKGYCYFETN